MKLPQISGRELIKRLRRHGFVVVRQKGYQIRLEKNTPEGTIKITVPDHKTLKRGTLHRIIKASGLKHLAAARRNPVRGPRPGVRVVGVAVTIELR